MKLKNLLIEIIEIFEILLDFYLKYYKNIIIILCLITMTICFGSKIAIGIATSILYFKILPAYDE